MDVDTNEYIAKDIAAQRLGRKPRTILEWADQGTLGSTTVLNPRTGRQQKVFLLADVERLERERAAASPPQLPAASSATAALAVTQQGAEAPPLAASSAIAAFAEMARLLMPSLRNGDALSPNEWLTVDEAAGYKRCSRALIVRLVRDGRLAYFEDEPVCREGEKRAAPHSGWRVKRGDLDTLAGAVLSRNG